MLNIDLLLDFDISMIMSAIDYLVFVPKYPNINYIKAIHYSYQQCVQLVSLCVYIHNVNGKTEYKFKDLNYIDLIKIKYNPNFIFLCETMTKDHSIFNNRKDYVCFISDPIKTVNGASINGFVLMIRNEIISNVIIVELTKFYVYFELLNPIIGILCLYCPPSLPYVYNHVEYKIISLVQLNNLRNTPFFVGGDGNALLGSIIGDKRGNCNGNSLLQLCDTQDMVCINEFGQPTFVVGYGSKTSIPDVVLTQKATALNLEPVVVVGSSSFGSDHLPIILNMECSNKFSLSKSDNNLYYSNIHKSISFIYRPKFRFKINHNDDNYIKFKMELVEKMYIINCDSYNDFRYKIHKDYVNLAIKYNIIKYDRQYHIKNNYYGMCYINYSYKCVINNYFDKIKEFRNILINLDSNDKKRSEYVMCINKCNDYIQNILRCIDILNELKYIKILYEKILSNDSKAFFNLLDKHKNIKKYEFINKNGELWNITKFITEAYFHFEELMKPKINGIWGLCNEYELSYNCEDYDNCPPFYVFYDAHKAINADARESFDYFDYKFMDWLLNYDPRAFYYIVSLIWRNGKLSIFDIINILICLKKPNGSIRGIGISNYTKRIITYVAWSPVMNKCLKWLDNVQFAFRPGSGCDDAIAANLIIIFQQIYLVNNVVISMHLDSKKAYPYTIFDQVFVILKIFIGLKGKIFRLLYNLLFLGVTAIEVERVLTDVICRYIGLGQGDVPSTIMYNVMHQVQSKFILNEKNGIKLNILQLPMYIITNHLYVDVYEDIGDDIKALLKIYVLFIVIYLAYADDTNVLTNTISKMQSQMSNYSRYASLFGTEINTEKTKYIIYNKKELSIGERYINKVGIFCNGNKINEVNSIKCLGVILDNKLLFNENISHKSKLFSFNVSNSKFKLRKSSLFNPMIPIIAFDKKLKAILEANMAVLPYSNKQINMINNIALRGFKRLIGINPKTSNIITELLYKRINMRFRYIYLRLTKMFKILNANANSNFSKVCLIHDMLYVLCLYKNRHFQKLVELYPNWNKLYSYKLFILCKNLGCESYFNVNLNKMIAFSKFKGILKYKLREKFNKYYLDKLKRCNLLTHIVLRQNDIISIDCNNLYKRSIIDVILKWCKLVGMEFSNLRLHPQFWNIISGVHHLYWSIRDKNGIISKLYEKCGSCGNNMHENGDPFIHLFYICKNIKNKIRILNSDGSRKEILIPKKNWIDKSIAPIICNSDPILKVFKQDLNKIINKLDYIKNEKIEEKYWNNYEGAGTGICDLNWSQFNYAIWCADKVFNIPISYDRKYYNQVDNCESVIIYR